MLGLDMRNQNNSQLENGVGKDQNINQIFEVLRINLTFDSQFWKGNLGWIRLEILTCLNF